MALRSILARRSLFAGLLAASLIAAAPAAAQGRARGWLGIAMDKTTGSPGVHIGHVVRGSPADKVGIHEGDWVQKVDGAAVASADDVIRLVALHALGDTVTVTLARGGKEQPLTATLAAFPSPEEMMRMDTVGAPAPAFASLTPLTGFPATLAAARGQVVLLDFWASWCGPCRVLAPVLNGWQARYGAQGLSVLGVTTDAPELAASARQALGMRYAVASDAQGATSRAYNVSALPTLFVIDKRGVVRDVSIGYDPGHDAAVEALVKTLLAEPAPDK